MFEWAKDMSLEQLQELLKKRAEEEKKIDKLKKENKKIKKLEKKLKQLEKVRKEIDKKYEKVMKRFLEKNLEKLTHNGNIPSFYYSQYGVETNIRDEFFDFIKSQGFKISKLKKTQIEELAKYIHDKIEEEFLNRKDVKKFKNKINELDKQIDEIEDKIWKIKRKIEDERKIPYTEWEIENAIKWKQQLSNPKIKEREKERERFEQSFEKLWLEWKKKFLRGG